MSDEPTMNGEAMFFNMITALACKLKVKPELFVDCVTKQNSDELMKYQKAIIDKAIKRTTEKMTGVVEEMTNHVKGKGKI